MAKSHLIPALALGIALSLNIAAPQTATAAMAVVDAKAIAEAKKQITEMKKQLEELKQHSDFLQEQLSAIGNAGKIAIPIINASKLASQLQKDATCLLPDLSKLMPDVDFDNVDFGTICATGDAYRTSLWVSPKALKKLPISEQVKKLAEIASRRENILVDAASKGMGQADIGQKAAADFNKAATEIVNAADQAEDTNTRLAVIAEGQAVMIRAQAQTNQLLAQQLKVQSAFAMAAGVRLQNDLAEKEDDGKEEEGTN